MVCQAAQAQKQGSRSRKVREHAETLPDHSDIRSTNGRRMNESVFRYLQYVPYGAAGRDNYGPFHAPIAPQADLS